MCTLAHHSSNYTITTYITTQRATELDEVLGVFLALEKTQVSRMFNFVLMKLVRRPVMRSINVSWADLVVGRNTNAFKYERFEECPAQLDYTSTAETAARCKADCAASLPLL